MSKRNGDAATTYEQRRLVVRMWMVGLLGALAAACSSDPASVDGPPAVAATSSMLAADCFEDDVVEGQAYQGINPSSFPQCELLRGEFAAPTFVVRLKDCRSQIYYGASSDGYKLPFPTPWIHDGVNGCIDPNNCTYDPGPYRFERALLANVNGMVSHQFLVRHLSNSGNRDYPYLVGHSRFYNGTLDASQLNAMVSVTSNEVWTTKYNDVTPYARKCTYVLQYNSTTHALEYSGYHSPVGQGHDPIDWPN